MPLKLWDCFCKPAVAYTSHFDCVMKATAWKMKVANMFDMQKSRCWSYSVKCREKITANYNSFEKMNPIKGL